MSTFSMSSNGSAFSRLFSAISMLENMNTSTASSFFTARTQGSASQVTVSVASRSRVTAEGEYPEAVSSVSTTQSNKTMSAAQRAPMRNSGLEFDREGKETRDEMLKRRRKECAADEVDVALAPVLKIQVPYTFYPEQYKRFRLLFPRVNVDSGLSYTHHDHPVAHTATMVGIRYIQSRLQPGSQNLDLHGNPTGNEHFNRFQERRVSKRRHLAKGATIHTLVQEHNAADAVRRVTKWGPRVDDQGHERWFDMDMQDVPTGVYDDFISIHTLYYYSMYDVCRLMNKHKKSTMYALVNYSKEQTGTLYGELKFSKVGGMTTQTSPNGERYNHPDIDQWFQSNSFRPYTESLGGGIAWTSHNVGGPLYVITVTRCDFNIARMTSYNPPEAPTLVVQQDRSFLGLLRIGGKDVKLRISNPDLAAELRHFMTFRNRSDPQVFQDLVVKARRCTTSDLVDGTRQHRVNDGELQDHIVYAYLVDAPGELELMDGVKLLKGDLLHPLAEALKLEGDLSRTPYLHAMLQWLVGVQSNKLVSLKHRSKNNAAVMRDKTAGLLPINRT